MRAAEFRSAGPSVVGGFEEPKQISLIGDDRRLPPCQSTNVLFSGTTLPAPLSLGPKQQSSLAASCFLSPIFRTSLNNVYVGSCASLCLHSLLLQWFVQHACSPVLC